MTLYGDYGPSFLESKTRIILDIIYWVFAAVYMVGDWFAVPGVFSFFTALTFVKAIPIWIMIYELWGPKNLYQGTEKIVIGLVFGSLGDILLLINGFAQKGSAPTIFFAIGALSFLIGHIFYVLSFLQSATDSANNNFSLSNVMSSKILYIIVWLVLVGFCFFSLSQVVTKIEPGSIMVYVVPIYGTILLMLVMASLFYYFTSHHIDNLLLHATVLAVIGSLSFLSSDTLLAFYTFHPDWKTKIVSFLLMLTYYIAQFLIGKSGIKTAAYFNRPNKGIV